VSIISTKAGLVRLSCWLENGPRHILECASTLGHVVTLIDNGSETISTVREEALETAGEYTFDRQENSSMFGKRYLSEAF